MFIGITVSTIYFINVINNTPKLAIIETQKKKASKIYDDSNNFVKQINIEDYGNVTYEQLPDVFIDALIATEDVRYFIHSGIDLPRIVSAIKNDIASMSLKEGASTLTQQLIKNMMLTNTKSLERKIQEMYLSYKIEKLYNKKEIIEFYCNFVCFDGVNNGVLAASYKYFNKHVSYLTLPEASLLVGVVNAPTAYSPILNPLKANERKNIVLKSMYNHNFIDKLTYNNARKIEVKDILSPMTLHKDSSYSYQSYIDVIYKQIYEKTGYDIYLTPMEIYTYMDSALQKEIDNMQNGSLKIKNKHQQFASTIIDNNTGSIKAIFGGKNYNGQRLLNKAYDVLFQPASTIKIHLCYDFDFEYLNYSSKETLLDEPINYPSTTVSIKNVDNAYLGEMNIAKAIGLSRNTTAIKVLEEVINKIGVDQVVSYLKDINLMDGGTFSYSYGLGGYTYGVSVTNMAAAYSMIARGGIYIETLTVKYIKLLDGSNKTINFTPINKKVLSEDSCYLLTDVLKQVMDNNYWSINSCKPHNVNLYAKSGTSSFDKETANKYNIPTNASKDKWLASFTKDYSIACWTGFDKLIKDEHTYFDKNSTDADILKSFTKTIYSKIAKQNIDFIMPISLKEVEIVKGSHYLATDQVNKDYIEKAIYKKDYVPNTYFVEPRIEETVNYDYFIIDDYINFVFNNDNKSFDYNVIFDYEKILGNKNIYIDIYENFVYKETINAKKIMSIPIHRNNHYQFDIYYKYENGLIDGSKVTLSFIYN